MLIYTIRRWVLFPSPVSSSPIFLTLFSFPLSHWLFLLLYLTSLITHLLLLTTLIVVAYSFIYYLVCHVFDVKATAKITLFVLWVWPLFIAFPLNSRLRSWHMDACFISHSNKSNEPFPPFITRHPIHHVGQKSKGSENIYAYQMRLLQDR